MTEKQFPKTRRQLFDMIGMGGKYEDEQENFNKALSDLMREGLVEYSQEGYYLTNPRGVKAAKKVIKEEESKK